MEQKKILLKSLDVQPFKDKDEYIDIELYSSIKEIKDDYLPNNFDLNEQYDKERNESRKFFIYGRLYGKQVDTNNLLVTLRTSDNDVLYVPNKKNNILQPGAKSFSVFTKPIMNSKELSRNIFNKIECGYFFQFEIDSPGLNSGTTKSVKIEISGSDIFNFTEREIVLYDEDKEFISYGTTDTVFDTNFNLKNIDNDFPFLYDYHWIKQDFDIVTFNKAFFPFKQFQDTNGNIVIDNSTTITDGNKNPTFQLLMDYPSFFGLERANLSVFKTIKPREDYIVPLNLFNSQKFTDLSPWKGFPANIYEWGVFGWSLNVIREKIINNPIQYKKFNIFDTSQQFYDANHRYYLSYLKGANLNSRRGDVITDDLIIKGFLDYSQSIYKKDVDSTFVEEFISGFTRDVGKPIDNITVAFSKGEEAHDYNVNLNNVTFFSKFEYLQASINSVSYANIGQPSTYLINVIAENKNPTATFELDYQLVQAKNQDLKIKIVLDKKYQGLTPVDLKIEAVPNKTTAVSLAQAIEANANYPYSFDYSSDGKMIHDYSIQNDTVTINKDGNEAEFSVRVYYSNQYFLNKTLTLRLTSHTNSVLIDEFNNTFTLDISQSVIPGWTKYYFPSNNYVGNGMFRSNRLVSDSNAKYNFELESPITFNDTRYNFTPNFKYKIACINAGETSIYYGGEYGGQEKTVNPGETIFEVEPLENFQEFDFVLPSNQTLNEVIDRNDPSIKYSKYINAKYEFRIRNIDPVVSTDSSNSSIFDDVVIPAQTLFSFINTRETSFEEWRKVIDNTDFFDSTSIKLPENIIKSEKIGGTSGGISREELNKNIEKCVFVLRTGIKNIYYPRPLKYNDFYKTYEASLRGISQVIDPNNSTSELSTTILSDTTMFGTIILNKTATQNSTKIDYRAFSNNRDAKDLVVPAETTINGIESIVKASDPTAITSKPLLFANNPSFELQQPKADSQYFMRYFNFSLKEGIVPTQTVFVTTKANSTSTQTTTDTNTGAVISQTTIPAWSLNRYPPSIRVLKFIDFSPALNPGITSFDDSVPGIKPLNVFAYVNYDKLIQ
jgi:hypothetical protein